MERNNSSGGGGSSDNDFSSSWTRIKSEGNRKYASPPERSREVIDDYFELSNQLWGQLLAAAMVIIISGVSSVSLSIINTISFAPLNSPLS